MSSAFELHPTLAADTLSVATLPISELRLMKDARFPWCILIPRVQGLTEWHQLPAGTHDPLMAEIKVVSEVLLAEPAITKLNVGALGNRVPQLHIHVLGRHPGDPAWPDPVWGFGTPEPYEDGSADGFIARLLVGLSALTASGCQ